MQSGIQPQRPKQLSLRIKILIGFTILFSGAFALAFYWFYTFATEKTMHRLYLDMRGTALGAAKDIDVEELLSLYKTGKANPNPDKTPSDYRYLKQLQQFQYVHEIESRAWLYTYVVVNASPDEFQRGMVLSSIHDRPPIATSKNLAQLQPGQTLPTVLLVDLWMKHDLTKAAKFLEVSSASEYTLKAYRDGAIVDRPLYDDGQFGSWISTYIPLKNSTGQTVAILGVDFEADYVREVQAAIRDWILLGFLTTYVILFVLIYLMSALLTKPIINLTKVAARIGEGDYEYDMKVFQKQRLHDEISALASVFTLMISKVRQREETLKQQVVELKVEIDEVKRKQQVSEIVETDFFQNLQAKAQRLRRTKTQWNSEDTSLENNQVVPDNTLSSSTNQEGSPPEKRQIDAENNDFNVSYDSTP